jgi:RNA polymerase sigma-70 factor (ECF subfamily)
LGASRVFTSEDAIIRSDSSLIADARRGDRDAFAELVRRYQDTVLALAYAKTLSRADAEDVTQQTFLTAYERLNQLRSPDSFAGWLTRVAYSQATTLLRKRGRETVTDVHQDFRHMPEAHVAQERFEWTEDVSRLIAAALRSLPEQLRAPFVLRYMRGASYESIAETLLIGVRAAEKRAQRGRRQVREFLERHGIREIGLTPALFPLLRCDVADSVTSRIDGRPANSPNSGWGRMPVAASALGVAALIGTLGGIAGVLPVPWGTLKAQGSAGAEGRAIDVTIVPGAKPRIQLLMRPGEELEGWEALEPDRDFGLPARVVDNAYGGKPVAVTSNAYGIHKRTAETHGEVTLSLRVRVNKAPSNTLVGLMLNHSPQGQSLLWKDEANVWRCGDGVGSQVAHDIDAVEGRWRDVIVVYRTWSARYDLYLDGDMVARDAVLSRTAAGKSVTGVYLSSGRGDKGAPLYFANMRVSGRDSVGVRAARPGQPLPPPSPKQLDRMTLYGGSLAGNPVDPADPVVTIAPGSRLSGWLDISVTNEHLASGEFRVIETPTWGTHAAAFREVNIHVPPGATRHIVNVDRRAPLVTGVYHLILAGAAETEARFVASGTNWPHNAPVWDNGTDIAGWNDRQIAVATTSGTVMAPWLSAEGDFGATEVGAVAVRVVVVSDPAD